MRKVAFTFLVLLGLVINLTALVFAQSEEYRLNLHRNFGYSSGSQIRGLFSIDVIGPANIKTITYRIDGQVMAQVVTSPFGYSFQTSHFSAGWHDLSADIETLDGRTITTGSKRFEFVTAEQETSGVINIVIPILGGVLALFAIILGGQFLINRKRPGVQLPLGASRDYGIMGGGVCPRCHRPYPLHWWTLNIGFGTKFDRCIFCGKWAIIRRSNKFELASAEISELQMAKPVTPVATQSEEERLREMVDNSRYTRQ